MRATLALALLALSSFASAQTPYLVKDINTTRSSTLSSSAPTEFAAVGNKLFFPATTAAAGTELWVSDGTSAGTKLVADIVPGSSGSSPSGLMVVNGVLLFNARDTNHGIELWTSDGTAAGTHLFMDMNPGPSSGQPAFKFLYKNRVLFSADDGTNGRELWITDGTVGGTRMLEDINPGSGSSSPFNFVLFGDKVYFFAFGGLWKTAYGTEAGTVKVASVSGRGMVVAGSRLFFEGNNADTGWEPWISDGTEAGTHLVTEILPGAKGSLETNYFQPFAAIDNGIVFLANDGVHGRELWTSDGTAAGTRMVRDFLPGAKGMWDTGFASLTAFNGRAYFAGFDDQHGSELWVTDGTDAGTQFLFDLVPGSGSGYPSVFTVAAGKLFFVGGGANNFLSGAGMWVTDGSAAGTHRLDPADALGLGVSSIAVNTVYSVIDGKLYFPGFTPLTGIEPWVTDGTDAGTHMIANIVPDVAPSSYPSDLTPAGNLLFFYATEGTLSPTTNVAESSLWRTDGTSAGTFKLKETGQGPADLVAAGSVVFFPEQINSRKLWTSDGTVAGTKPADGFMSRLGTSKLGSVFPIGDTLFATIVDAGGTQTTLWKMSGVLGASSVPLGASNPFGLVDDAGRLVFFAKGPASITDYGLWTSDGTPEGTYAFIPDLGDTLSQRPGALVNAGGTLFFSKTLRDEKPKLWKSDGTFDGTVAVKEMPTGISDLQAAGHRVFFRSAGSLWTSDGTEAGTIELVPVKFYSSSNPPNIIAVGDRVVFAQFDDAGFHLWGSDGTLQGTKFLLDLGYIPFDGTTIDGLAYFSGSDALHGSEPWTTDGTPEGTKLLADLNPGTANSYPSSFRRVGNLVYFTAYTDTTGYELWALPLTDPVLSIGDARAPEDGVAHFTVSLAPAAKQAVTVDYATSDGAAHAGEDYDAAAGTLTFAAGETSKTIDVHLRGDTVTENDETFFVTLRNARGARVARAEGAGIIEDDDQIADVGIAPRFDANSSSLNDGVTVSNAGPRAATDIVLKITSAPAYGRTGCSTCSIAQVAPGQSLPADGDYWPPSQQTYLSATATARQRDPQPSNNATAWTISANRLMAMNAAFLTTGATATVTAVVIQENTNLTVSDPSVISLGSVIRTGNVMTFPVTALRPGTSTITLGAQFSSLAVTVVAPGATPRWPGALSFCCAETLTSFDKPVTIVATATGTAPLSGAKATGTIVVTAAGEELARAEIGAAGIVSIPIYFRKIGTVAYTVAYAGDANFLPQSTDSSIFVGLGKATLNATLAPVAGAAGTFALTVEATGSPVAPPTGTLSVVNGTTEIANVQLVRTGTTSIARATLTNLTATPSLTVNYAGNPFYLAGSQQVRVVVPRGRAVRH